MKCEHVKHWWSLPLDTWKCEKCGETGKQTYAAYLIEQDPDYWSKATYGDTKEKK